MQTSHSASVYSRPGPEYLPCRAAGFETIMMNCNPETVSTDYDTSSRLYFEPLTVEDVLNVVDKERPDGIIVQFGGQTPLSLASKLQKALKESNIPTASGEVNIKLPVNPCWNALANLGLAAGCVAQQCHGVLS